ncbi:MAG: phage tail assembly chaperone [Pseudomonadota bacterium]|nr:phage tail assembly chaperone [Pseudomonadota bacterium]
MPGWSQALRQAAAMGIAPAAFWRLSLREWRALTAPANRTPLRRSEFLDLLRQHEKD